MLYFRALILFVICFPTFVYAQVGIGTTSPDASAKLQIDASASGNAKGLLPPRVALSATNSNLPFSVTPATGLLVYNTASVGSGATAVTPGFYYYSGTAWTRLIIPTDESFFVTLNTAQTVAGIKTFSNDLLVNGLVAGRGKGSGNYVYNTAVGVGTLDNNSSGWGNTGVGYHSLKANTSGMGNSAFGFQGQMSGISGDGNTSFGFASLIDNTTGSNNTSMGYQALQKNNGSNNIAIGSNSMYQAQNATQNIVVGSNSLTGATVNGVSNNIILGNSVLQNVTNAANNVVIGMGAGTSNFTSESNNTLVGYGTQLGASGLTNATAIGNGASVSASNTIQLGNTSVTSVNTSGTVTSAGFIKSGGTSSQFLMANGTATSSPSLAGANSLPLTTGVTGTLLVANGGTGAATAAGALTNLGFAAATYISAAKTITQTITNSTSTILTNYSNNVAINAGEWNATTGVFTASKAGVYAISGAIQMESINSSSPFELALGIYKNSSLVSIGRFFTSGSWNQFPNTVFTNAIVRLNTNDKIDLSVWQNSGVSWNTFVNGTYLTIQELPANLLR